ncbi:ccr4 associated factor [Dipsacomyces acuminosporus]|nr:ccr4 associated factor [Dipsacomyces acuminosporus]
MIGSTALRRLAIQGYWQTPCNSARTRASMARPLYKQVQQQRQISSPAPAEQTEEIRVEKVTDFENILDRANSYSQIRSRAIIEVAGKDASEFLQGMQCNHMPIIDQGGAGMLTGFLAPQGRVIADAFVYPKNAGVNFPHPVFLVEVDALAKDRLLKIMGFYKLRAKITLRDATDEYSVWGVWGPGSSALVGHPETPISKVPRGSLIFKGETSAAADVWLADARAPGMGLRLLLPKGGRPSLPTEFEQKPSEVYSLRRILKGVPEGADDFVPDVSVPLECNLDYMGGVHFSKGCYVGQELTIRTHHRGVVRKRIVPVILSSAEHNPAGTNPLCISQGFQFKPQPQADISQIELAGAAMQPQDADMPEPTPASPASSSNPRRSRRLAPGKLGSSVFNAGLALMRLEHVEAYMAQETAEVGSKRIAFQTTSANGSRLFVSPWSPSWWPSGASG